MTEVGRIRDRARKVPDHECREALLGAKIKDVIQISVPAGVTTAVTPAHDTLYLVREDGSAVEVEADRLYFDLIPDFEDELDAIRIVDVDGREIG